MKLNKIIILLIVILLSYSNFSYSQISGSFNVGGDIDKFYPVTFFDGAWSNNVPTNLKLGRSDIHLNTNSRGTLMADFNYHVTNFGYGSYFIDADIKPALNGSYDNFVAGWRDVSSKGGCRCIVIWLRGGQSTYYYQSTYAVNPTIYDGIQNALPFNEASGISHSFKDTIDNYAITTGTYQSQNAYYMGNVGIGTTNPTSKLTVAGNIASREVKVTVDAGADFVFENNYTLPSLDAVDKYIKDNKHLPDIASADEMKKEGINLSEMNIKLLQKIEEMTLYMIEQNKQIKDLKNENQNFKLVFERLSNIENKLK